MTIEDRLIEMRGEQARGEQGSATRALWRAVNKKLCQAAVWEIGRNNHLDLVQRSFLVVWGKIDRFELRGPGSLSRWLREIVRREALALRAERARRKEVEYDSAREPDEAVASGLSSALFKVEQMQAVDEQMAELTTLEREALRFADTHALAEAKQIPVPTARMRRRRGLLRLIARLRRLTTWRRRIPTSRVRVSTSQVRIPTSQ